MNLAMRYGYDIDKAELAGLLHARQALPDSVILKKCLKHGIPVTEGGGEAVHAPRKVRAWLTHVNCRIEDSEILNAIASYKTGDDRSG